MVWRKNDNEVEKKMMELLYIIIGAFIGISLHWTLLAKPLCMKYKEYIKLLIKELNKK